MIDTSQLEDFARRCEALQADLKPYAGEVLDKMGEEFLDLVQAYLQSAGNIDQGTLLASCVKGGPGNIYQLDLGGLTLTVGTSVYYAKWVNKGHGQQPGRFVPGYWEGKHFRYSPGAKTGMVLKASFVRGSFFFDKAVEVASRLMPELAKSAFEQFFSRYFS